MFTLSEKYREAIVINPYKEARSLTLVQLGKDGKTYVQWCKREMGKEKKVVNRPVGLTFESEAQLKEFAQWLMNEAFPEQIPRDDIPF